MKNEIKFLGHTFIEIEAEIKDTKMTIQNFQKPKDKKGIQRFLGLVNWDRRFIKGLTKMAKPLKLLLQKGRKFQWKEKEQEAFAEIKRAFAEAPMLYLIRPDYKFDIFIDAAKSGLGARFYQYENGEEERFTVAYASRSLKGAELNYKLECLALVWALKKWHTLLLGRHVRIHTDHKALQFLSICVKNNPRIAR